jgi:hypothetical protein
MKKLLVMVALGCLVFAGLASADLSATTYSHVFVNVVPNITLAPALASVDLGTIQVGHVGSGIVFRVDANTEKVKLSAGASKLYKGDCPICADVAPILLDGAGIKIVPDYANPLGGASTVAGYIGGEVDIKDGFMGQQTDWITFESAQNNHFSQNVTVTPGWVQTDAEKPIGEYSGVVALYAMVVPIQ